MKVMCINNDSIRGSFSSDDRLTIGKWYDVEDVVLGDGSEYYKILKDDNGDSRRLYKERFITLKEYRRRKLEKISGI